MEYAKFFASTYLYYHPKLPKSRAKLAEGASQTLVVVVYVDKEKRMAILALTR